MKCIKNTVTGSIIRTSNRRAEKKVNEPKSDWVFCKKGEWKATGRHREDLWKGAREQKEKEVPMK